MIASAALPVAMARRASSRRARTNWPRTSPSPPSHGWKFRASKPASARSGLPSLVVERCQFDGKIVARCDQIRMTQQLCKAALRSDTCALPKLVAFIQNAAILRIGSLGTVKGSHRASRVVAHVEERDAKVAMHSREVGIELCGALPELDGLFISPAIVKQVAEIIRRARILRERRR